MVELRKATATNTPVCECAIWFLGVSEWLYEMVAVRSHSRNISGDLLGPLGFECSQHRQTLRPSVDGVRSKALHPFGLQSLKTRSDIPKKHFAKMLAGMYISLLLITTLYISSAGGERPFLPLTRERNLVYRSTSFVRNRRPLGPYSRNMPRALWWSLGVGVFLSATHPCRR